MLDKWDYRFLRIARETSTWSKDPSSQIGAVVTLDRRILSTGYNGIPASMKDCSERLNNREEKYKHIVHAEMNAIYNATKNGISLSSGTLYVYGLPVCSECAKGVISVGITRVVSCFGELSDRWLKSHLSSIDFFGESGIIVETIPMEKLYEFDG